MPKIKKIADIQDMEQMALSYVTGGNIKCYSHFGQLFDNFW